MIRRPPRSTRTDTLFPYTTRFRSYRRELEDLIAARNLGGVVHIVGGCNDMPAVYKLSDVVVSASTDPEGFGRVMAEAQAMGRPVIAADHGEIGRAHV